MRKRMNIAGLLMAAIMLFPQFLSAANSTKVKDIIRFTEADKVDESAALEMLAEKFQLEIGTDLVLKKVQDDELGMHHVQYRQFHQGIEIVGAGLGLHSRNGKLSFANYHLYAGLEISAMPSISDQNAVRIAIENLGLENPLWENNDMERWLQDHENDPNATWKPSPELILSISPSSGEKETIHLIWKMDLHSEDLLDGKIVYVDAHSGRVLDVFETCHTTAVQGTAVTRYSGTQVFTTDSVAPNLFTLNDESRGAGISTLNLRKFTANNLDSAVEFVDTDNFWDNANAAKDDAATDCHWGVQNSYDYFLDVHGRNSYDGAGGSITSYVHYDNNVFNAFWFGGIQSMFFGDGSGGSNPLTSIDVAGHELSHGVTQFSPQGGLLYYGESGALNEAYSDIFGTAIEFYAGDPNASWIMGRANFALRDISNPRSFGDPDTYQDNNWVNIIGQDNGGVHTNSGVFNYWYYLLSMGGSGVNFFGTSYDVHGLGLDTAAHIAYRAYQTLGYLDFLDGYLDAYHFTMQSAIDLYGCGSNEVQQTLNAWKAVGIGGDSLTHDMEMIALNSPILSGCELGNAEEVEIRFKYNQQFCGNGIPPGSQIPVGARIRGGSQVINEFYTVPPGGLNDGDIVTYTFNQKFDLSTPGRYRIESWVGWPHDALAYNDTLKNQGAWQKNATEVIKPLEFDNDFYTGFERGQVNVDTFVVLNEAFGHSYRQFQAGNGSFFAMRQTAQFEPDTGGLVSTLDTALNFSLNSQLNTQVCFCIDATLADRIDFWFDLRQTYSPEHIDTINQLNFKDTRSSMRVLVNGNQLGPQYHPTTPENDPYVTIKRNLDAYAGTSFSLCFQGNHWVPKAKDSYFIGDNTDIDNIRINMFGSALGNESLTTNQREVKIFPNPNTGNFTLELRNVQSGNYLIDVFDLMGRKVETRSLEISSENASALVDLQGLSPGIYSVVVNAPDQQYQEKVVVE